MTKDEVTALGVEAQRKKDLFSALCHENTQTDPEKRADQVRRYEQARTEMHEAMNAHHRALGFL